MIAVYSKAKSFLAINVLVFVIATFSFGVLSAQKRSSTFKVVAFYTAKNDEAHIGFVHEANKWFPDIASK